jgi:hypothetical protein
MMMKFKDWQEGNGSPFHNSSLFQTAQTTEPWRLRKIRMQIKYTTVYRD